MAQTAWQIWRKKNLYFSTKQKLLKYTVSFLQNWKNKCYSPKQKMFFHILSLLFRIDEINIFIILPSIKKNSFDILFVLWRIEKNGFIILLNQKKSSLNILGLLCRIEKNILKITWRKLLEYPGSSEQNKDPGCLRTEVRGDFNIDKTKHF